MHFFSLQDYLIDIIILHLNIKDIIKLKYVSNKLYTIIKTNSKYIHIIQIIASNYIKFW